MQDGKVYTHSTAVMRFVPMPHIQPKAIRCIDSYSAMHARAVSVMALLDGPVHLVSVLWLVPWPLRDFGYRMVARCVVFANSARVAVARAI